MFKRMMPLLAGIAASGLFGFGYYFVKLCMAGMENDTFQYVMSRYVIAFVFMSLMLLCRVQKLHLKGKPLAPLLLCGLLNPVICQVLDVTATIYAPTSQISIVSSAIAPAVVLFSALMNRELPTRRQLLFMLLTLAGVFIVQSQGVGQVGTSLGFWIAVTCTLLIGVQRTLVRRYSADYSAFEIIYVSTACGAVVFPIVSVVQHILRGELHTFFAPYFDTNVLLALGYNGIISCVFGFLLMTYSSANLPVAVAQGVNMLTMVVSVLVGALVLHEPIGWADLCGIVLVIAGIIGVSVSYHPGEENRFHRPTKPSKTQSPAGTQTGADKHQGG